MARPARSIRGIAADGEAVVAHLSRPFQTAGRPEWICAIYCPALFENVREIAGADADQALALADMFVGEMFGHGGIAREKTGKK